ncbi:alpha/beta-hydrolase [Massarina eburnea CBS 473.64]|uniref:Alpha/beta-hydrolase n=1 Tax=Massarina eburnea CBS 473.64 TaxID=1395130 RepID=A0A6A6RUH0_9PLEO|nr:alpha/beta-hydrolase [Massarina eburnea CBS 473.64]
MSLLTVQPFKGIYLLGATAFEFARLPLWIFKYLTPYGRQHSNWSFRQALGMRLFYSLLNHTALVQIKTPLPQTPGKEKDRWIIMTLREEWKELFKGPMLGDGTGDVIPGDIGGTWYTQKGEKVLTAGDDVENVLIVLHIHGGAYVTGDGRTEASGYFASKVLKNTPATHILAPQYRLSTLPASKTSNPFPAALQDTLTSYLYLLNELKVPAKNIVLSGDSAGANSAIALLRYISEYGDELSIPAPGAALLWSPWIDPSDGSSAVVTSNRNHGTDYLTPSFVTWGHLAYAGLNGPANLQSPYANAKVKAFGIETPIFVNAGTVELLYDDDKEWVEMMAGVDGNRVWFDEEAGIPHDVLLVANLLGFDDEADAVAKRAGEWLRDPIISQSLMQESNNVYEPANLQGASLVVIIVRGKVQNLQTLVRHFVLDSLAVVIPLRTLTQSKIPASQDIERLHFNTRNRMP